jgi:hypothetical protein
VHGYMMPSSAAYNNYQPIFTWLHYAPQQAQERPQSPVNPGSAPSHLRKLGENSRLAARESGMARMMKARKESTKP